MNIPSGPPPGSIKAKCWHWRTRKVAGLDVAGHSGKSCPCGVEWSLSHAGHRPRGFANPGWVQRRLSIHPVRVTELGALPGHDQQRTAACRHRCSRVNRCLLDLGGGPFHRSDHLDLLRRRSRAVVAGGCRPLCGRFLSTICATVLYRNSVDTPQPNVRRQSTADCTRLKQVNGTGCSSRPRARNPIKNGRRNRKPRGLHDSTKSDVPTPAPCPRTGSGAAGAQR